MLFVEKTSKAQSLPFPDAFVPRNMPKFLQFQISSMEAMLKYMIVMLVVPEEDNCSFL